MDEDKRSLLEALNALDPARCTYSEWVQVGMALKAEGLPCSAWDEWSQRDTARYTSKGPECCEAKWKTFKSSGETKGGTIVHLAEHYNNYTPNRELDWDDGLAAYYEEVLTIEDKPNEKPYQMAVRFLETLFDPDETVSYVHSAKWNEKKQKWNPGDGGHVRKVSDIIKDLKKHRKLEDAFGTFNEKAGGWIRVNPATGPNDGDVTRYAYALAESDDLSIEDQKRLFINFKLPIATLTESGGKSVHALVKIDAKDEAEYAQRVQKLFDWLAKHNFVVDENNKNPSRLSRLPGVMRDGKLQRLIATNIGCASWHEWQDYIEGVEDDLPAIHSARDMFDNPTPEPPAIIDGVLRKGAKMICTGDSKSGKTCLLTNLAICIAEGWEWLGHQCMQGKVLYINMEVMQSDFEARYKAVYKSYSKRATDKGKDNFEFWNLRGKAQPLEKLAPKIIRRCRGQGYLAIIVDPIYKVQGGDENSAEAIGKFCGLFDKIAEDTGASLIYVHHHAKGAQGGRKAIDRGSGSGVFARDADAIIDFSGLVLDPNEKELARLIRNYKSDEDLIPLQMEMVLRSFKSPEAVNMFFEFPLHVLDVHHVLDGAAVEGTSEANRKLAPNNQKSDTDKKQIVDDCFESVSRSDGTAKFSDMYNSSICNVTDRTLKKYILMFPDDYLLENGVVKKLR